MAQVGIVGAGSWGTALSVVLAHNGHDVTVWSIIEDEVTMLNAQREHKDKLPGVKISDSVAFTTDLKKTVEEKALVVLAVPSPHIRSTARSMAGFIRDGQLIVAVSKGIEENTLMIQTDIVEQEIPQAQVAVLSGPSHAEEVGRELPTTVVAGAKTKAIAERVQAFFMNEVFRVYTSPDMLGIELGSSLKNVIALAAGMADGLGFRDNTKAALITRGIAEIGRLASAMGAKMETVNGLSGIGDLIVTCASRHSRNRKAGMLIGQGYTMEEAMDEVKMVVEGVYSAKAALALAEKYEIDMPIVEQVNRVLFEGQPAKEAVLELMLRERKPENGDLDW
ncbi:MAG: NAD(P)-dependent glycerol-3-phosphate dehydrogenase [Lachnospiraceae bacterium]|nr:NAD(P)-dependent glycerol-3-phosphate dehydrogenase [Lachnospiraceae bacterium]